ncbi:MULTISPECIES: ABC transporter permease [Pseudothermotoga]|uniref:Binding-protein-dependent transport systems inner membrane component n=1 Tax=Pseudothermotoga lettingae (strain ATCC BAA-301 / DSM 14385 / NBRC 107922 / TMO) TaxID=416591 RepID=A8F761_PSELT|nr:MULTISPECIES: ABC transporter permease [Pseudothermotoga]ABV33995.1 binding-protein-dependent transport systems inner membrane component [Pseudothermotoga lettingae TMO]KUK21777.1 MAG: Binding-protein-dependent transport systems inner membrane component [Pseudothermotoga lettingae]MDI3495808.1 peptide/nickel transport system permease protein [Pseudothermotoga sp.]MDK2884621.1 peptide/nickel transport system permease protein [Pseudothermotoga sp.]GLI49066.1 peptide ABC transporter permease [
MRKFLCKKVLIYILTFFFAVTIDWAIPRFMPGNPIHFLISRFATLPESAKVLQSYFTQAFGLDKPLFEQYINFWKALLKGDLGTSIYLYPQPVLKVILRALPYSIGLLLPAILVSFLIGNRFGAFVARKKKLDNVALPIFYTLTASPYFWFGILLAWLFGVVLEIFPIAGAYSFALTPSFSWRFITNLLYHWVLPFVSLVLVMLGGWAIGMRNMIIYELEANYSRYLETLGASQRLVRRYAYKNAILPQITGLATQLGTAVAGTLTTEIVFSYPGIGYLLMQGILNQDYFLVQGCFLFIILGVLIANFLVDIFYVVIDPRIRKSYTGEV